jgi:hypothetical protein
MSVRSVMPTHCVLCHNKFGVQHQRPGRVDCNGNKANLNICSPCLSVICKSGKDKNGDLKEHYAKYPAPAGYDHTSMVGGTSVKK